LEKIVYEGGSIPKGITHNEKVRPSVSSQQTTPTRPTEALNSKRVSTEAKSDVVHSKPAQTEPQNDIEPFIEFTDSEIGFDDVKEVWGKFREVIKTEKKGIMPVFENASPLTLSGNRITIGIAPEDKLFINIVQNTANLKYLETLMSKLLKKMISLQFEIKEEEHKEALNPEEQVKDYFKDYKDVLEIK